MRFQQGMRGLALAVLSLAGAAQAQVSIVNANDLTGGITSVVTINNAGAFAGSVDFGQGGKAFVHDASGFTNISQLLGAESRFAYETHTARAINQSGAVVGEVYTSDGRGGTHAFVYADGKASLLSPSLDGMEASHTLATGINDAGLIVGSSMFGRSIIHPGESSGFSGAISMADGQTRNLGNLGGPHGAGAWGVNNSGQIVGSSSTLTPRLLFRAFVYSDGVMTDLGMPTSHQGSSYARDINDAGQIVGEAAVAVGSVAFLYEQGQMRSLGGLGGTESWASAINESGVVVGSAELADGSSHAFVYTESGGLVDLNSLLDPDSGWVLQYASDINDQNVIVGSGTYKGVQAGFILAGAAAVPEPGTFALLAIGLGAAAWHTRRSRARA